jgi:hypothetical protein
VATYYKAIIKNIFDLKNSHSHVENLGRKINASEKLRDFDYLLSKFKDIEIIKNFLFNNSQNLAIEFSHLEDSLQTNLLYSIYSSFEEKKEKIELVTNYFVNILLENPLNEKDEFIFQQLDPNLKEKIMKRVSQSKNIK